MQMVGSLPAQASFRLFFTYATTGLCASRKHKPQGENLYLVFLSRGSDFKELYTIAVCTLSYLEMKSGQSNRLFLSIVKDTKGRTLNITSYPRKRSDSTERKGRQDKSIHCLSHQLSTARWTVMEPLGEGS